MTLLEACQQVIHNPAFKPNIDPVSLKVLVTHCNQGALFVAQSQSCRDFDTPAGSEPLMADAMISTMIANASGKWKLVPGNLATAHALAGGLAFAAATSKQLGEAHGHICTIYPAAMQWSGSLNKNVPTVANVGTCQKEEKVSEAFPVAKGEPGYFIYG